MPANVRAVRQNRYGKACARQQALLLQLNLVLTGTGTVSTDELPGILTSLGYNITEEDVAAQIHQVFTTCRHRKFAPVFCCPFRL